MACPDGIAPHILQYVKPAGDLFFRHRRTQCSRIVMHADAFHPEVFSVEKKSFVGIELKVPEPNHGLGIIKKFPPLYFGNKPVESRIIDAPQMRAGNSEDLVDRVFLHGGKSNICRGFCYNPVARKKSAVNLHLYSVTRFVDHRNVSR